MYLYKNLSLEPGLSVDPETGVVEKIQNITGPVKGDVGVFVSPSYDQTSIDLARLVTSNLGEQILCSMLGGRKAKRKNNKGYDILLPNGIKLEVKTGRIRNVAVIKNNQLEFMDKNCLFGFVFYRTTNNKAPSFFTSQNNRISPVANLKRNIQVESIFLLPHPSVVYYYNTCELSEREIGKTGIKYKPLGYTNSLKIFNENPGNYPKYESEKKHGKHKIKVYSLGYEIK